MGAEYAAAPEPMRHAFVVRLGPARWLASPGFDTSAMRYVERHDTERDDPDDLNALVHTFAVGGLRLEVGFGRIMDAHQFPTLESAVEAASSDYLKREWVQWRGYRVSVVAVRVRWKSNAVIEEYGDVGPEVWPEGDLPAALAQLEKAGPKPNPDAERRKQVAALMSGLRENLQDIVDNYDPEVIAHGNAKACLERLEALAKLVR